MASYLDSAKLMDLAETITQLPGTDSGEGLGAHVLQLFAGILGGTLAQKFMEGDEGNIIKKIYKSDWMVHVMMMLIITSQTVTYSKFEEDLPKTLLASLAVYVWFNLAINARPYFVLMMLACLVAASMIYRVRRSPNLVQDASTMETLQNLEIALYIASMCITIYGYAMSFEPGMDKMGPEKYLYKAFPWMQIGSDVGAGYGARFGSDYTVTESF